MGADKTFTLSSLVKMRTNVTATIMLALFLLSIVMLAVPVMGHSGVSFSAWTWTPPTIDGTVDTVVEWAGAATASFASTGGLEGIFYVMNDDGNLYIAVRTADPTLSQDTTGTDAVWIYFDNNNDGAGPEVGDDIIGWNGLSSEGFRDGYSDGSYVWRRDTDAGGDSDGSAEATNDGTYNYFEISHPLDTTDDVHDFSLLIGDTVGFTIRFTVDGFDKGFWPTSDTAEWHDIEIAESAVELEAFTSTPPIIDGIMSPGEWDSACAMVFNSTSTSRTHVLYVMNDQDNLYLAVRRYDETPGESGDWVTFTFDNDHEGLIEDGDDRISIRGPPPGEFEDWFYSGAIPVSDSGWQYEGTVDGSGAVGIDGTYTIFEISHPLNSGDYGYVNWEQTKLGPHDFSLCLGDTVGFNIDSYDNSLDLGAWPTDWPPVWDSRIASEFGNITVASPLIYQGDMVLSGNIVCTIEGRFDINGSIIIEDNATLHLKDAYMNFTQIEYRQYNINLRNPSNGNPRLLVYNSTITSDLRTDISLEDNSTATIDNSTITYNIVTEDLSKLSISSSYVYRQTAYDSSTVNIHNSTISMSDNFQSAEVQVYDSEINLFVFGVNSVECKISKIMPGLVSYWNLITNCSMNILPGGYAPNLTLTNTTVNLWNPMLYGSSYMTVTDSTMYHPATFGSSILYVVNSAFTSYLHVSGNSLIFLVNSTYTDVPLIQDQARIQFAWYLDVHVIDSEGTDVPSANVTATYHNETLAESKLTDINGWTRLILTEKMRNATGEYPVGNYTITATYETHTGQESVNMTDNQEITIELPFIIPEFPTTLLLPILIIITTIAVILTKRRSRKPYHLEMANSEEKGSNEETNPTTSILHTL